jgi:hypothetical protein
VYATRCCCLFTCSHLHSHKQSKQANQLMSERRRRAPFPLSSLGCFSVVVAVIALLLVLCCDNVSGSAECLHNSDCVPAICCGSTACLPAAQAEDCSKTSCQAPCKPFTVDCGGQCTCSPQKRCAAVLNTIDGGKCTSKMKRRGDCWW